MLNIHPVEPPAHSPRPLLVDKPDAAKTLSISERSLDRLVESGKLPVVKLGRSVKFALTDLQELIDKSREVKPPKMAADTARDAATDITQNNAGDGSEAIARIA